MHDLSATRQCMGSESMLAHSLMLAEASGKDLATWYASPRQHRLTHLEAVLSQEALHCLAHYRPIDLLK